MHIYIAHSGVRVTIEHLTRNILGLFAV